MLTSFDYDAGGEALVAFAGRLAALGADYPHRFALRPNRGMATGLDLDGDGRAGRAADAQGWGRFAGERGMAVLSQVPIAAGEVRDFSAFLWADLPESGLASGPGAAVPAAVAAVQRLASTGAWEIPLALPGGGRFSLLAFAAGLPLPGDANGRAARRNGDEIAFWRHLLDGRLPMRPPATPFVLAGTSNLDPADGAGRRHEMAALLVHPALRDPGPESPGGAIAGRAAAGPPHLGEPARDTAALAGPAGPGNLRLDYVLPSAGLDVVAAGVLWPPPDDPFAATVAAAGRGRLVWVEVALP